MRIYIHTDLEGVTGLDEEEQRQFDKKELYRESCEKLMLDVNAAIEGAFDGGADHVIVMDGHAGVGRQNFILEMLDERAEYDPRDEERWWGKLDESCWQGESIITGFVSTGWRRARLWDTTVHVTYDDENLYVAFKVPDLTESTIKPGASARGISGQDGCEILLDTGPDGWSCIQIVANANGAVATGGHYCGGVPDATCKLEGVEAVGSVADGGIEVRIPLEALSQPGLSGKPITIPIPHGAVWGANFARNAHADKPGASWVRAGRGALSPSRFNAITLVGPRPD